MRIAPTPTLHIKAARWAKPYGANQGTAWHLYEWHGCDGHEWYRRKCVKGDTTRHVYEFLGFRPGYRGGRFCCICLKFETPEQAIQRGSAGT